MENRASSVFVVIPAYKCKDHVLKVIEKIPSLVSKIIVVDDCCPVGTGKVVQEYIAQKNAQQRIEVVFHTENQGVGGAMVTGYRRALELEADVVVKIDGDDQMDPSLIPQFIKPILRGKADYTKGNRFFYLEGLAEMPKVRLFGNAVLSFLNKLVSGYWNIMDPTNGYTAVHADALKVIPLDKLARRFFFESDILFRLGVIRAVVQDIPMHSKYGDEVSNLKILDVALSFPSKYLSRYLKRIFYNYFLRDFTAGSLFLLSGIVLCLVSFVHGTYHWVTSHIGGYSTPIGTVMIPVLLAIIGFQMILFFLQQDIESVPQDPIHHRE